MSFAVMMGSVFPTLGCVTSSRTAGMGQMNRQLVASLVHSHMNQLYCLIARRVIVLYTIFVCTINVYYGGSLRKLRNFCQPTWNL